MGSMVLDFGSPIATSPPFRDASPAFFGGGEDMFRQFAGDQSKQQPTPSHSFKYINAENAGSPKVPTSSASFDLNGYAPALQEYIPSSWQQDWSHQQAANDHSETLQDRMNSISRFGQITPPDDKVMFTTNLANIIKREHDDNNDVNMADLQQDASSVSRRKSSTASASKRSRKGSRGHNKDEEGSDPEEDAKREKFLERNRVAASKCRQKKKEWTNGLEDRLRHLQAENTHLKSFTATLRDEVLSLKGEMLKHQSCGCHGIRNYLANQASNLAYQQHPRSGQESSQYISLASPTNSSTPGSPTLVRGSIDTAQAQQRQNGSGTTRLFGSPQGILDQSSDHSRCNKSKPVLIDDDINETFEHFSDEDFDSYLATTMGEESSVKAVT